MIWLVNLAAAQQSSPYSGGWHSPEARLPEGVDECCKNACDRLSCDPITLRLEFEQLQQDLNIKLSHGDQDASLAAKVAEYSAAANCCTQSNWHCWKRS